MQGFSRSKDEAVSPVIGTILIIALTVIIVGIFASALLGYNIAEPAPILGISITQEGNITTLTHLNGEVLTAGSYKILVDGEDKTADFGGTVNLSPGMTLTWDSGTEAVGTVSVVYMGMNGGETVLMQKSIGKAGSGGGSGDIAGIKILDINGVTYNLSKYWGGVWQDIVEEAKNKANVGDSVDLGNPNNYIYYDNGNYWVATPGAILTKADSLESITSSITYHNEHYAQILVYIDTTRTPYTPANMNGQNLKPGIDSFTLGALRKAANKLYIKIDTTVTRSVDESTWLEIGIKS